MPLSHSLRPPHSPVLTTAKLETVTLRRAHSTSAAIGRAQDAQPPLPAEDLTAARSLVRRDEFAQALVLANALRRLYGSAPELCLLIDQCEAQLAQRMRQTAQAPARAHLNTKSLQHHLC